MLKLNLAGYMFGATPPAVPNERAQSRVGAGPLDVVGGPLGFVLLAGLGARADFAAGFADCPGGKCPCSNQELKSRGS